MREADAMKGVTTKHTKYTKAVSLMGLAHGTHGLHGTDSLPFRVFRGRPLQWGGVVG